jgi:hypothetical protein
MEIWKMSETIAVAIKTAKRGKDRKDYLQETLENLYRSVKGSRALSFPLFTVHTEGPVCRLLSLAVPAPVRVLDGPHRTLHQNACMSIAIAADAETDWAMVLEDDLDFCDDFIGSVLRWLYRNEREGCPMYAFGANYTQIQSCVARKAQFWTYPVSAFYGAQALVWRSAVAKNLAEWLGPDPDYNGVRDHGHDLLLQKWGHLYTRFFLASAPSFVQHIGEESGIGNRFFRFPSWPGRDWRYE